MMQRLSNPNEPVRFVDLGPGRAEGVPSFGGSIARPVATPGDMTVETKAKIAAALIARHAMRKALETSG